jgi:acetyl-CoA acetyltransferase
MGKVGRMSAISPEQLRDKTAIVGVGNTAFGAMYRDLDPERTSYELAADAFKQALDDSGLKKSDIDGLICVRVEEYQRMTDYLGLRHVRLVNGLEGSGRMAGVALQYAVMAIATGQCETVAVVYGNNGRSAGATYGGGTNPASTVAYDSMYGMTSPGAYVSHMFRRHMHEFGTTEDALAALAVNNRKNGAKNPNAVFQKEISHEEYMQARYIAEPLRLFDYCIINDGGVALIVTTAEKAKTLNQPPAYISATYTTTDLTNFYTSKDCFYTACKDVADRIYKAADISRDEIDVAQVYDNFLPTILFSLEGFGFCERGEAGKFVQGGRIELDGDLPINTSGGHTSESYMQGFALTVEAVRQLRGQAGDRQVPNCDVVQYICASPIVNSHILRR